MAKFNVGDWVKLNDNVDKPFSDYAQVHSFEEDGTMNLIFYNFRGERMGRISRPEDNIFDYEPYCDPRRYYSIDKPRYPQ